MNVFASKTELSLLEKAIFCVIAIVFISTMAFPQTAKAFNLPVKDLIIKSANQPDDILTQRFNEARDKLLPLTISTKADKQSDDISISAADSKVIREMYVPASAYSSTVDQCDASPCITANGFNVCKNGQENVIAANFLPFGTKVKIPDLYGDRIFTVQDRMNRRYYKKIDIWMTSRERAIQFGVKNVKIQIVE